MTNFLLSKSHSKDGVFTICRSVMWTVLFCIAVIVCATQTAVSKSQSEEPSVVTVTKVSKQKFLARTWMSGSVVPLKSVSVFPQITGYPVTSVLVDIGDTVAKGDVLATFDAATLQAELAKVDAQIESAQATINRAQSDIASAQAHVDKTSATLARTQTLVKKGTLSQSSLDTAVESDRQAQATLASNIEGLSSARAALRQVEATRISAQLALDHTKLVAPVGGIIAARDLDLGDLASMVGTSAFIVYENGALEVAAEVVETSLGSLTVGDDVQLSIAGVPDKVGTVRLIAPTVDTTTRLGSVQITLVDPTGVRAGLFSSGWITTETRDSLSVPVTAVQTDAKGTYVLVVNEGGVLARTVVTVGLLADGRREILSGLTEGKSVVVRAGGFFADGDVVTPLEETL